MISVGFKMDQFKSMFFDKKKVMDAVPPAERRILSRFGAFVMTRAKQSLRYRDRRSSPGEPPSVHRSLVRTKTNRRTGVKRTQSVSPLRDFTFFAYQPITRSVIIGPAKLNSQVSDNAPEAIEYGGESTIVRSGGKRQTVHIKARPWMGPAFQTELTKLPPMWRDSIRGG